MSDPMTTAAPVHVFTDEQFKQLLSTLTPGPGFVAKAETVAKTGAEDVVANFKALVADVEATLGHVHGAAKQLQLDVKSNRVVIGIGVLTVFNSVMLLLPLLKGLGL